MKKFFSFSVVALIVLGVSIFAVYSSIINAGTKHWLIACLQIVSVVLIVIGHEESNSFTYPFIFFVFFGLIFCFLTPGAENEETFKGYSVGISIFFAFMISINMLASWFHKRKKQLRNAR